MALLEIRDLVVRYGRVTALRGVSMRVEEGQTLAVLGRNGAGKSSLLGAVAGLVRPSAGTIAWKGRSLDGTPPDRRARRGICLVPEGRRIFPALTVAENLRLGGFELHGSDLEGALERASTVFPVLAERAGVPAGTLSGGQQQMLSIGRALMRQPELLLLDEPSLGLAPNVTADLYGQLRGLHESGIALVVVEQHIDRALELADRVMILRLGEVVLQEDAEAVSADDPRLREAYMGQAIA